MGAARHAAAAESAGPGRILGRRAHLDRDQRPADSLFRHARSRTCPVRVAGISQRAGADLGLSRLWRAVGASARRQGRALHFDQRQGQLVHRPHRLSGPQNDRACRCRGRPAARRRWPADHRTRLVRLGVDRARWSGCVYRPRTRQRDSALRFQQGVYPARAARWCRRRRRCASCRATRGSRRW